MEWATYEALSKSFYMVEEIDLTGSGEPLMNPNLEKMIGLAKESGIRVGFSSNGVLLTPARLDALMEHALDWIAISCDAATEDTYSKIRVGGSFNGLINNLQYLGEMKKRHPDSKPYTMLFFVMMKENIHELPDLVQLASKLQIDLVVAKNLDVQSRPSDCSKGVFEVAGDSEAHSRVKQYIGKAVNVAQSLDIKLRLYETSPTERPICEQDPLRTMFVSVDGFISPCISLAYMNSRFFAGRQVSIPIYKFGNINESSIDNVFQTHEYVEFRRAFERRLYRGVMGLFDPIDRGLSGSSDLSELPPPPVGCESCYYLYGI
jgi:MoaA/NifB/PqqE/SkfB family radical SAM enzyme